MFSKVQRSGRAVSVVVELPTYQQHLVNLVVNHAMPLRVAVEVVVEWGACPAAFYNDGVGASLAGVVWSDELVRYVEKANWSRRVR